MKPTFLLLALLFVVLFNNKSSAQEKTAFEKGTIVATAGYALPDFYRVSLRSSYSAYNGITVRGFGPMILKGDYGIVKFKWGHSVGAGIVLGFSSTKAEYAAYKNNSISYYGVDKNTDIYRTITIGARGSYHFFTKEKIDCYVSIGLGYNINSYSSTNVGYGLYGGGYGTYSASPRVTRSSAYTAFTVGIRYYFTKNIGVYSELGWDMSAPIQAGLAIKF